MSQSTPLAFDDFLGRIQTLYSAGKHAPSTLGRMKQVLKALPALGVTSTADLTTQTMALYVHSLGPQANANTVNGYLSALSAACGYAWEEGWLDRRPNFKRVKLRPTPMVKNLPASYKDLGRLLDHLYCRRNLGWKEHRLCALTWTFALTAARLREALYARLEDLDLVGKSPKLAIVPRRRLKTEESARNLPLPEVLSEILGEWLPHAGPVWLFPGIKRNGPWTGGSPGYKSQDELKAVAKAVGITQITWHSLRHAFGTYSLEHWDVPLWVVQRVMGHTDQRTTARYLHLSNSPAIAAAVRSVSYSYRAAL